MQSIDDLNLPPEGETKEQFARRIIESRPDRCCKCHKLLSPLDPFDYICRECDWATPIGEASNSALQLKALSG